MSGMPTVVPTSYVRADSDIYIHGSAASRMAKLGESNADGCIDVCLTVTLLDGLVLARSAFNHSMNYRSTVIYGKASLVTDRSEKRDSLRLFSEHVIKGRWDDVRAPTTQELKGTAVLKLPISCASAKIRTGPPEDDEEDYDLSVWAGVIPLHLSAGAPVGDPRMDPSTAASVPGYAIEYRRGSGRPA